MAQLTHPDTFTHRLQLDRRRCFVIVGRPGEGKTRLARAMAARYDGLYLDLLTIFAADPALSASIDSATPQWVRKFLQPYATGRLLLIDEMEFLWHCWNEGERQEFLNVIRLWMKPAFFGVFLPPDPVLETLRMVDQDGVSRTFALHDLQALA